MNDPKSDPTWFLIVALIPQFLILYWPDAVPYLGWTITATVFGFIAFCAYAYLVDWITERRQQRARERRLRER